MKELNEGWEGLQLTSAPFLLLHPEQLFFQLLWGLLALHSSFLLVQISCFLLSNQPGLRKVCILNGQDVSTLSKWLRVVRDVISLKEFKLQASPWRRALLTHPGLSAFLYALSACVYVSLSPFLKYFLDELYFKRKKVLVCRILLTKYYFLFTRKSDKFL